MVVCGDILLQISDRVKNFNRLKLDQYYCILRMYEAFYSFLNGKFLEHFKLF